MQRHIADRAKSYDHAIRLREYLRIARRATPHPASLTLQRRAQERVGLAQFLRIARQEPVQATFN